MGLRRSLSRGSRFKLHFYLGDGETDDRTKVSTSPLSKGLLINNTELQDILMRTKCMAIQIWLEIKWQVYESRDYVWHEIISILSPLWK